MLKQPTAAKVELVDCDTHADGIRKVFQVHINGVPVWVTERPHIRINDRDESRAVEVTLTLMVSELTVRAATDSDMRVDVPQEGTWKYTMPPLADE